MLVWSKGLSLSILVTSGNSEDPDEMLLHTLLRFKQLSGTELHHNIENSTCDPLKYTMGSPMHIVSLCMGKSISA